MKIYEKVINRQKTKIIATLGDPSPTTKSPQGTYRKGLFGFDRKEIEKPSLQQVIDLYFENGADVIRINLAHMKNIPQQFPLVKEAILKAEKKFNRKVGVLADLPGPKIRFKTGSWIVPEKTLRISFDSTEEQEDVVQVKLAKGENGQNQLQQPYQIPNKSTAIVNLGDLPFGEAAPHATAHILEEIDQRRKTQKDEPLLAFIGDSDCTLEVEKVDGKTLVCKVVAVKAPGRVLRDQKGFTIREISKKIPAFTETDKSKLTELLRADYDGFSKGEDHRILSFIGISFCQTREDVRTVLFHIIQHLRAVKNIQSEIRQRDETAQKKGFTVIERETEETQFLYKQCPLIIAKIETVDGVKNIDEILDLADGAMIARGDLALEGKTVDLPKNSKNIIHRCNLRGKPVIMATQMLESMKSNIECARPEASDVFNAVVDGADALLLSGETSSGMYPAHAIQKMKELSEKAEEYLNKKSDEDDNMQNHFKKLEAISNRVKAWEDRYRLIEQHYRNVEDSHEISRLAYEFMFYLTNIKDNRLKKQNSTDRISHAACMMAVDPAVVAIVAPTTSGRTARMLARFRPAVWIIAQPHSHFTARRLALTRGVWADQVIKEKLEANQVEKLMELSQNRLTESLDSHIEECRQSCKDDFDQKIQKASGIQEKESLEAERRRILVSPAIIFTCGTPLARVGTTNMIKRIEMDETGRGESKTDGLRN